MDSGILDLIDLVTALKAEIKRLRATAQHVLDKSCFSNAEELADLGKAISKLQRELDRVAPSMGPSLALKGRGK